MSTAINTTRISYDVWKTMSNEQRKSVPSDRRPLSAAEAIAAQAARDVGIAEAAREHYIATGHKPPKFRADVTKGDLRNAAVELTLSANAYRAKLELLERENAELKAKDQARLAANRAVSTERAKKALGILNKLLILTIAVAIAYLLINKDAGAQVAQWFVTGLTALPGILKNAVVNLLVAIESAIKIVAMLLGM